MFPELPEVRNTWYFNRSSFLQEISRQLHQNEFCKLSLVRFITLSNRNYYVSKSRKSEQNKNNGNKGQNSSFIGSPAKDIYVRRSLSLKWTFIISKLPYFVANLPHIFCQKKRNYLPSRSEMQTGRHLLQWWSVESLTNSSCERDLGYLITVILNCPQTGWGFFLKSERNLTR